MLQTFYEKLESTFAKKNKPRVDQAQDHSAMSREQLIHTYVALREHQFALGLSMQETLRAQSVRMDPEQVLVTFAEQHMMASDWLQGAHGINFYNLMREFSMRGLQFSKEIASFHEMLRLRH